MLYGKCIFTLKTIYCKKEKEIHEKIQTKRERLKRSH